MKMHKLFTALSMATAMLATSFTGLTTAQAAQVPEGTVLAAKQELNYNGGTSPDTIDPSLMMYSDAFMYGRILFSTLTRENSLGKFQGDTAESWNVSEDGKTWTFHLRKDAKWSDGKPVRAQDFVYSWQRLTDPKTGAGYGDYLSIANVVNAREVFEGKLPLDKLGVRAADDHTLVVQLTQPTPWLVQMVSLGVLAPLREDVIKAHGEKWTAVENIVTNGPFKLVANKFNDTMDFVKNENYWDAKNTVITKIHFDFINNPTATYFKYLTGEYPTTSIPVQYKKQVLAERPEELVTVSNLSTSYLRFNVSKVADARVREAIALLIDRKFFVDKILGSGIPTSQFTPPNILDGQYVTQVDWFNNPQAENTKRAIELLKEAGYSKEKPFVLTWLLPAGAATKKILIAFEGMLKQATDGLVEVKQNVVESRTYAELAQKGEYEVVYTGWGADYNQISTFLLTLTCDSAINSTQYCNKEYDDLLKQAAVEQDAEKRAQLYAQAVKVLQKDWPVIPLEHDQALVLKSPALGGYNPTAQDRYFNDYYLIADKAVKKN